MMGISKRMKVPASALNRCFQPFRRIDRLEAEQCDADHQKLEQKATGDREKLKQHGARRAGKPQADVFDNLGP